MDIRLPAVTAIVAVIFIILMTTSSTGVNIVFAGNYEKSQVTAQTNECGNYWFPLDVLCSNLGSQVQGDKNSISIASAQQQQQEDDGNVESSKKSYGPPFP
jgi:hypothetical protein